MTSNPLYIIFALKNSTSRESSYHSSIMFVAYVDS